jgi:outer membrane protein
MTRSRAGILAGLLVSIGGALSLPALAQSPPAQKAQPPAQPAQPPAQPAQPPATQPTTGRVWSLADVLEHAVRHAPTLQTARIDVNVARASVMQASGIEDLLVNFTGSFQRNHYEAVEGIEDASGGNLDTVGGTLTLSKLFFTGGTLSVQASGQRSEQLFRFGEPAEAATSANSEASITAQIQQPLLRGFGSGPTRIERTRAEVQRDQQVLQREISGRTTVRDLIAAYWEVGFAWSELEIRRASLELARERRRLTDASVRGGATAPTELLAVDQVIAQREEDVVVAELGIKERSLEFRRLAGIEIEPEQPEVRIGAPLAAQVRPMQLASVFQQAMERSPEIAQLEVAGRGATIEVEVAGNGLLPRFDLRVYGGPIGNAVEFNDAVSNLSDGGYQVGGEIVIEEPIPLRGARGARQVALQERERVRVNMADMRRQIAQTATQAVAQAQTAEKRMQLSRTAIDLTQRNIKAETGRFELGKSSNFDVLLRQEEHTQARLRFARATADYLRAIAFVEALTGEILPRYGIKVE